MSDYLAQNDYRVSAVATGKALAEVMGIELEQPVPELVPVAAVRRELRLEPLTPLVERGRPGAQALLLEHLRQRAPLEQLHREIQRAVGQMSAVVDRDAVRMIDTPDGDPAIASSPS